MQARRAIFNRAAPPVRNDGVMNAPASEAVLLRLPDLADELGLPAAWLKERAALGEIPCLPISRRTVLYNLNAVRTALAELAATTRAEVSTHGGNV